MDSTFPHPHKPANQLTTLKFPGRLNESLSLAKGYYIAQIVTNAFAKHRAVHQTTMLAHIEAQSLSIQPCQSFMTPIILTKIVVDMNGVAFSRL